MKVNIVRFGGGLVLFSGLLLGGVGQDGLDSAAAATLEFRHEGRDARGGFGSGWGREGAFGAILSVDTLRLSLGDAVERGLRVNESVESARAGEDAAAAQVLQARASALPQASLSTNYNRTLASVFDDIGEITFPGMGDPGDGESPFAALPFGRPNIYMGTLQVSQLVYSGGQVAAAIDIARSLRRASRLEVEEAESQVTLDVRSAYMGAVLASKLVAIAEDAYRLADDHLEQVKSFRERGTASDFDVLSARVERDNLEPALVEARNGRHLAELDLKRLVHIPADQPLVLTTPLSAEVGPVDAEALQAALASRPALEALEEMVDMRDNAASIARRARFPSVSLMGTFGYQAFPDNLNPMGTDWRRDWTVGVNVTMPVFTGNRIQGEIAEADADLRRAELQRSEARRGMDLELSAALGDFEGARAQIEARRSTVEHAERAFSLAELRFESGMATQLELSSSRLALQQARVNEAQAVFNYINALARLERVTGGVVPLFSARIASHDQ